MEKLNILAVIQNDLQLICNLRGELEASGFPSLKIARNSDEAVLYLRGVGIYADRDRFPLPSVLVLDCENTDGSDLEVLSWVREQDTFHALPVVLLCHPGNDSHYVSCALDHACFLLERENLGEIVGGIRNLPMEDFAAGVVPC